MPEHDLSVREAKALKLIALGYSSREIAEQWCLSMKTIETYKKRATEKLGIKTRVEIVRSAFCKRWLDKA